MRHAREQVARLGSGNMHAHSVYQATRLLPWMGS